MVAMGEPATDVTLPAANDEPGENGDGGDDTTDRRGSLLVSYGEGKRRTAAGDVVRLEEEG